LEVVITALLPLHLTSDGGFSGLDTMDTKFFEEYQTQLLDWQKKFFNTWLEGLPKGTAEIKLTDTFETSVKLQEELVKSYLEAQEKSVELMLESQKQFWNNYFEAVRKQPVAAN